MIFFGLRVPRLLKLSSLFDCRKFCNISKMASLESLHFDNLALRSLPLDKETENFVRQVPFYANFLLIVNVVRNASDLSILA